MTTEQTILDHVRRLVDEERHLRDGGATADADRKRLSEIEVDLDQCWDLLRQRRAKKEFGADPNDAKVRDPEIVERYIG